MKDILQKIFSIKNDGTKKILTILGIRVIFKNSKYYIKHSHQDPLSIERSKYIDSIQDIIQDEYLEKSFNLREYLDNMEEIPDYLHVDSKHHFLNILLKKAGWIFNEKKLVNANLKDTFMLNWEIRPSKHSYLTIKKAVDNNKKIIFVGDSFLRSINNMANKNAEDKYKKGISFTFDDLTSYSDATRPSRLEQMLNNKNLIFTKEELERARHCIKRIVNTHLTKYNHQPIYTPEIGRKDVKKVLVVDQSYGDMSILKGLGNDETFALMLKKAIEENPAADIIIKTHPDTIAGQGGYYTNIKQSGNIYPQTDAINPISLIKYCDKVYVCSTQFGFEALMCGKEVHTFGMPFYAGWGLTIDEQTCSRRTNKRSLEEVFYITYILYSYYINPETQKECEIEEAMDYLLKLREDYFKKIAKEGNNEQ